MVSADLFPALGVAPAVGRFFRAEEDVPGGPRSAVISWELWQRRFGGDRAVVGRSIDLSGKPYELIGVLPPGFRLFRAADLYVPIGLWRDDQPVRNWMTTSFGDLPKYLFADQNLPLAQMMAAAARMTNLSDEQMDMQIQIMWSAACTGKFVWPIPDKGLKKRIHRIQAPTLIIWGRQDGIAPPIYAEEFAQRIKNARVELIDNAGHVPQMEQLQQVSGLVSDFLRS